MIDFLKKKIERKISLTILIGVFLLTVLVIWITYKNLEFRVSLPPISSPQIPFISTSKIEGIKKFSSEEEFKSYLEKTKAEVEYAGLGLGLERVSIVKLH